MKLYYQNETLYVDVFCLLDNDEYGQLRNRIFRIVQDYGIDNIIINNLSKLHINKQYFTKLKQEYNMYYQGRIYIK